jgi:AGZA family xanthine/uracil permease-like MFS transporter
MRAAPVDKSPAAGVLALGLEPVRGYALGTDAAAAEGSHDIRPRSAPSGWGMTMSDATKPAGERPFLDRYFALTENRTDVRTEFIAGLTTFLTMVYIVFVNPQILANAGMDKGAVFVATCLAAALSTLIMALYANYPIALAPGMGLNAFFAFTLVLTYKYTWQQALAFVFLSGVLALIITVTKLREYVITSIPQNLKLAVSAGVGLFLGIIALQTSGIVVDHPATLVTLGDLKKWPALLALAGFVIIVVLNYHKILGGTLIGILVVTVVGLPLGIVTYGGIVSMPPSLAPTFLQLDFSRVFEATALIVIFSLLFVDLFDTAGTLIGVTHRAGMLDDEGQLPRMGQALIADSSATVVGSLLGTSNTTSYIESTAGVDAGGRTGLTGVFVAAFFLLALFFSPLAGMIPAYASAAALLYVACVMTQGLAEITWDDITEYAPAVVTAVSMPLTYSIATGIGLGFITYALAKILAGKFAEAKPAVVILAVLFAIKFAVA